jgi:hypothetical protein
LAGSWSPRGSVRLWMSGPTTLGRDGTLRQRARTASSGANECATGRDRAPPTRQLRPEYSPCGQAAGTVVVVLVGLGGAAPLALLTAFGREAGKHAYPGPDRRSRRSGRRARRGACQPRREVAAPGTGQWPPSAGPAPQRRDRRRHRGPRRRPRHRALRRAQSRKTVEHGPGDHPAQVSPKIRQQDWPRSCRPERREARCRRGPRRQGSPRRRRAAAGCTR